MRTHYERENLIWNSSLTSSERLVLVVMNKFVDGNGECWPGVERIADMTGLGERTVTRVTTNLATKGILVKWRRRTNISLTSNKYKVDFGQIPQRPFKEYGRAAEDPIAFCQIGGKVGDAFEVEAFGQYGGNVAASVAGSSGQYGGNVAANMADDLSRSNYLDDLSRSNYDQTPAIAANAAIVLESDRMDIEEEDIEEDLEAPYTPNEPVPDPVEKSEAVEGADLPGGGEAAKKSAKAIKLQWFRDIFLPNYPYRLTKGGGKTRAIGKVEADPQQYLRFISTEAIESGQATDGLRNMIQFYCREYRAEFRTEPEKVKLESGHEVYVLPFVPDPARWFRDRVWKNQYDLGEPVASRMPWGDDEPDPEFLTYLIKQHLALLSCNEGRSVTAVMARSWLNGAKYNQRRFDDACLHWQAYQELIARQAANAQAFANAPTLQQVAPLPPQPDFQPPDLLTRLRAQYQFANTRGEAIRRAREAGIDIELLKPTTPPEAYAPQSQTA